MGTAFPYRQDMQNDIEYVMKMICNIENDMEYVMKIIKISNMLWKWLKYRKLYWICYENGMKYRKLYEIFPYQKWFIESLCILMFFS